MHYAEGLSLITPTGGRRQAIELCATFIRRQTWTGPLQWIIVDDAKPVTTDSFQLPGGMVTKLFPEPTWNPGQNTLARNLLAALSEVAYDKVLFIEDDDWYAPDYCSVMAELLRTAALVGERWSRYYHLPTRQFRLMRNEAHSSLCQTGIRSLMIPALQNICRETATRIDSRLWSTPTPTPRVRVPEARCVGVKGLPGRPGIGVGHRPSSTEWAYDSELETLRSWIGEDVRLYEEFTR